MFDNCNPEVFREVLERLLTAVYLVDRSRRIVFWNDGAEKITGYLRQDVLGRFCRDNLLEHCDVTSRVLCHSDCPLARTLQDGHPREHGMYLKHRDGRRLPVLVRVVAIRDVSGAVLGAAESFEAQALAPTVGNLPQSPSEHLDELTGLPNPRFVLSYVQQRTAASDKSFRPFSVLRLAVSHYPELLRRYGATACGGLLRNVAFSLRNALKPSDVLVRWGESQFVVALELHEEHLLDKVRGRLQNVVDGTRLDWWGDSIALKIGIDQRIVERRADRQSVLSWLGPPPAEAAAAPHVVIHALHRATDIEE